MDSIEDIISCRLKELSKQNKLKGKRIFLFGYNRYTEKINNFLHSETYTLYGIIDNDKEKQGKSFLDIPIFDPESIKWRKNDVVLTASSHRKSMKNQIEEISMDIKFYGLCNFEKYTVEIETKNKFWLEENYDIEIQRLIKGKKIWDRLKEKEPLIIIYPALGDMFACGLYLSEYEKKVGRVKVIIASMGVSMVAQLFGIENINFISEQEMEALTKYVFFDGKTGTDCVVCTSISILDTITRYKKIPFPKCWAKYLFRLEDSYQINYPSIWDDHLQECELVQKGLIKGKTVILAPYANTLPELPFQFWEYLVAELIKMEYGVFTNIVGEQKPINGTIGLEIPLKQIGNYLEYAGYFVSLRSGFCDVAGQSKCKQIIIFRDKKIDLNTTQIELYNLHTENISPNAIQYIYDENNFGRNINEIMKFFREN